MKEEVRIDKFLWAVRIFKTRSIAADACKNGKILMNNQVLKPSRCIKIGNIIQVKRSPIVYSFKVLALSENRMNAKLVENFLENVTTKEQLEILELAKLNGIHNRRKGTGRPTKKERRDLDDFIEVEIEDDFDDFFDSID